LNTLKKAGYTRDRPHITVGIKYFKRKKAIQEPDLILGSEYFTRKKAIPDLIAVAVSTI
jgi:hypothetical protein